MRISGIKQTTPLAILYVVNRRGKKEEAKRRSQTRFRKCIAPTIHDIATNGLWPSQKYTVLVPA